MSTASPTHLDGQSHVRPAGQAPDRVLRYMELDDVLHRFAREGPLLELGSGPGGLKRLLPGTFVVTVDLRSFHGLDVQADGCHLPFPDGVFATAVCIDVLEHVPPSLRLPLIRELRRVTADLLVVGGPMGVAAERVDRSVERWLRRTSRPVPEWLEEHLSTGPYPTAEEVCDLVGVQPLWTGPGVGLTAHRLLCSLGGVRGGTALGRALTSTSRGRAGLTRAATMGAPYRSVLVFDLAPVGFTVVMATKDRAALLPAAAESVLAQTERGLELIIVNDGSTDGTTEVARHIARSDARVRVIYNHVPSGSCGLARNRGLRAARGDVLAFCDDDVRWHPNHLAVCASALTDSVACYTTAARFLPNGEFYDMVGRAWASEGPRAGDVDANTIAVRRAAMRPFPDGRGRYESEDILLIMDLVRHGVQPVAVPEVTVDYTFNPESHCYQYSFHDEGGRTVVTAQPRVDDWRAARARVSEAAKVRLLRLLPWAQHLRRRRSVPGN